MAQVNGSFRPLTTRLRSERVPRVKYSTLCPSRSDSDSAAIRAMPISFGCESGWGSASGKKGSELVGMSMVSLSVRLRYIQTEFVSNRIREEVERFERAPTAGSYTE